MYCKRCHALTHYEADCTVEVVARSQPKKPKAKKKLKGKRK